MRNAVIIALLAVLLSSAGAFAAEVAVVEKLKGAAFVQNNALNLGDGVKPLKIGDGIAAGEALRTNAQSVMQLRFIDGGIVVLGENAVFRIDDFFYAPEKNSGNAMFMIDQGAFLVNSGAIAKLPGRPLHVATPTASIGVRGTKFWGGSLGDPLNVLLLEGAVSVTNKAGAVDLQSPGDGTDISSPDSAPSPAGKWKQARIDRALQSVSFQ